MTDTATITIETLEAIAIAIRTEDHLERARLARLIAAYAAIVSARDEDGCFTRLPLERADEDGHWDSSYPPRSELKDYRGPHGAQIREHETNDVATSSGYYHSWCRITTDLGLYIGDDGTLYGCEETGTGAVGPYAAHPGDHDVQCTLEYHELELDSVPLCDLRDAETELRMRAFPLVAARLAASGTKMI